MFKIGNKYRETSNCLGEPRKANLTILKGPRVAQRNEYYCKKFFVKEVVNKIGQREAIKILGRETFLSGLSRAAFHWSSSRESEDEKFSVSFYCGKLFK